MLHIVTLLKKLISPQRRKGREEESTPSILNIEKPYHLKKVGE
jgi:hypothetical protein